MHFQLSYAILASTCVAAVLGGTAGGPSSRRDASVPRAAEDSIASGHAGIEQRAGKKLHKADPSKDSLKVDCKFQVALGAMISTHQSTTEMPSRAIAAPGLDMTGIQEYFDKLVDWVRDNADGGQHLAITLVIPSTWAVLGGRTSEVARSLTAAIEKCNDHFDRRAAGGYDITYMFIAPDARGVSLGGDRTLEYNGLYQVKFGGEHQQEWDGWGAFYTKLHLLQAGWQPQMLGSW